MESQPPLAASPLLTRNATEPSTAVAHSAFRITIDVGALRGLPQAARSAQLWRRLPQWRNAVGELGIEPLRDLVSATLSGTRLAESEGARWELETARLGFERVRGVRAGAIAWTVREDRDRENSVVGASAGEHRELMVAALANPSGVFRGLGTPLEFPTEIVSASAVLQTAPENAFVFHVRLEASREPTAPNLERWARSFEAWTRPMTDAFHGTRRNLTGPAAWRVKGASIEASVLIGRDQVELLLGYFERLPGQSPNHAGLSVFTSPREH